MTMLKAPKVPCGSCPYRRDVPPGIWEEHEYAKLPSYDGQIIDQIENGGVPLFMCHQNDGCLCGGWLACHGPTELLAMRLAAAKGRIDPSVWDYDPKVPVFATGAEAAEHGMSGIEDPPPEAERKIIGLMRQRAQKVKS